jgi:hypothetical protein
MELEQKLSLGRCHNESGGRPVAAKPAEPAASSVDEHSTLRSVRACAQRISRNRDRVVGQPIIVQPRCIRSVEETLVLDRTFVHVGVK